MWRVGVVVAGGHPVREAPEPKISQTRQGISTTHRTRDRGFRLIECDDALWLRLEPFDPLRRLLRHRHLPLRGVSLFFW